MILRDSNIGTVGGIIGVGVPKKSLHNELYLINKEYNKDFLYLGTVGTPSRGIRPPSTAANLSAARMSVAGLVYNARQFLNMKGIYSLRYKILTTSRKICNQYTFTKQGTHILTNSSMATKTDHRHISSRKLINRRIGAKSELDLRKVVIDSVNTSPPNIGNNGYQKVMEFRQ